MRQRYVAVTYLLTGPAAVLILSESYSRSASPRIFHQAVRDALMSVALGVDWASGQWLCFAQHERGTVPTANTFESIAAIWQRYNGGRDISRLCIDIPIGIPTGPNERTVDRRCRSYLDRHSSVFRVPVREALAAESFEDANAKSRRVTRTEETDGVGVQPTAYGIREQILEVNTFISEQSPAVNDTIYEVHPELCFTALQEPPQYSKKTAQGVAERLDALDTIVTDVGSVFKDTLTAVIDEDGNDHDIAVDDVLDTLVAMYTAAARDDEFYLLTGDTESTPSQRMAYRSTTKLPPPERG